MRKLIQVNDGISSTVKEEALNRGDENKKKEEKVNVIREKQVLKSPNSLYLSIPPEINQRVLKDN